MKSAIIHNTKQKFYRPNLFLGKKEMFKTEYISSGEGFDQIGYYQSKKCTVVLHILYGWLRDTPELITMQCDYNGFSYYRNYNKLLSDHALKLACAKFCNDIVNKNNNFSKI